jgi:hypothetical protein
MLKRIEKCSEKSKAGKPDSQGKGDCGRVEVH